MQTEMPNMLLGPNAEFIMKPQAAHQKPTIPRAKAKGGARAQRENASRKKIKLKAGVDLEAPVLAAEPITESSDAEAKADADLEAETPKDCAILFYRSQFS